MKIAIECKSPLLQKSLELFLEPYITPLKHCEIVIRDYKSDDSRAFYISQELDADLIKPFNKSSLIMALESRCTKTIKPEQKQEEQEKNSMDFEILQKRIELLTKEYQDNILRTVKAFYEK